MLWEQHMFFFNHNALFFRSAARFTTLHNRGEAASLTYRLFMNGRGNAEHCGKKEIDYCDLELSLGLHRRCHNCITTR